MAQRKIKTYRDLQVWQKSMTLVTEIIETGSLYELQTQIEISMNLYYLNGDEFDKLSELSREIERMLSSLIRKLSGK